MNEFFRSECNLWCKAGLVLLFRYMICLIFLVWMCWSDCTLTLSRRESESLITRGGSRDTWAGPHRVRDQPWSFNGPYMVLQRDLMIFKPLSGRSYVWPLQTFWNMFWSLWCYTRLRELSWIFMDPLIDPEIDPAKQILGDTAQNSKMY